MKTAFIIIATLAVFAVVQAWPRSEFDDENNAVFETHMARALEEDGSSLVPSALSGGKEKGQAKAEEGKAKGAEGKAKGEAKKAEGKAKGEAGKAKGEAKKAEAQSKKDGKGKPE